MRYRDLIQFDPIESVIQLREADDEQKATGLVKTYVISDRMARQLVDLVLPQLQFEQSVDNKGVLVVGNYGTGKSHLMSVLSALAEYPETLAALDNADVREAAKSIAGRFKVIRVEITSERSLRDSLLEEIELALESWGISHQFPAADQVTNNKDILIEAMTKFNERYPDHGVLLIVDELLDFLRSREERQLIQDLGFLREIGEVTDLTRLRFLGGVQETLFDNPRFSFVAEQLRRVRDRFEQLRIVREDIAHVVSQRLLKKNDEQLSWINDHLRHFTPLYDGLAERLPEYTDLFPVHPAYIETFENIHVTEKRQVLRTLSQAMRDLMDQEVPQDQPGLISYDQYWDRLRNNPSMRTLPGVVEVVEKSEVLEGRIRNSFGREHLLPMALRIIQGLSVQRLTTDTILVPLGPTAEELRDDLALFLAGMPEQSAEFLLGQVQVALNEIMRTVSGQYISFNDANGQYYLDVKKDIDFDAKIGERGEMMGSDELNRFFFEALISLLDLSETTYVTGFRIWPYELPWTEHGVNRPGYLFFGAPDERSTAQPPRDFYVYLLPPFSEQSWQGETKEDEVLLRLSGLDDRFKSILRKYAGARALSTESATHRDTYLDKAQGRDGYLRQIMDWLRDNMVTHLEVTHDDVTRPVSAVLAETTGSGSRSIEELLQVVSSHLLTPHFADEYPSYPTFVRPQPISESGRAPAAQDAIRAVAGFGMTNLARSVLSGLQLVDNDDNLRPMDSSYAQGYLDLLLNKPEGQVVNRGELIEVIGTGAGGVVEQDIIFKMEPEWGAVILLALVHAGEAELDLNPRVKLDAGNVEQAATIALSDLTNFRFYGRPRTLPIGRWVQIFQGLGLQEGLIRDENTRATAVTRLQEKVQEELEQVVTLQGRLQQGLNLWNQSLFTDRLFDTTGGIVASTGDEEINLSQNLFTPSFRTYKEFLEKLARFNTVGKLRNLSLNALDINDAFTAQKEVVRAREITKAVDQLQTLTSYLREARSILPPDSDWVAQAAEAQQETIDALRRYGRGEAELDIQAMARRLQALKADYIAAYAEHHRSSVLNVDGAARRQRLQGDQRLAALGALVDIDLLAQNEAELRGWQSALGNLRACTQFHEELLADSPICTCEFRPSAITETMAAGERLEFLDDRLDSILLGWQQALRAGLNSEGVQQSIGDMTPAERRPLETFLAQADDDPNVPAGFVEAASRALRGIDALTLQTNEMILALKEGGLPCTLDELINRFGGFLREQMRGHDRESTRLTLSE